MNGKFWRRFHLGAMMVAAACIVPTVLWWSDSVLWIAFLSIYANFVGHFGAWQAARAEEKVLA